uniref:Uncharacterized protein n=1 Tax=Amphiprion ocellaris TaxID=80972 RepID=A0A3Q1CWI1_AMPOC
SWPSHPNNWGARLAAQQCQLYSVSLGDRMRSLDIWSRTTNPSLQKCRGGSTSGCLSLEGLNLHTGVPIVYELDRNLKPLGPMQFPGGKVKK